MAPPRNTMLGYTLAIAKKNAAADQALVGVQIGKICIARDIPVLEIARVAGVSRVAVYGWFTGEFSPRQTAVDRINKFLLSRVG